jgi:cell division protein FtsI (penicillin-binding protein 3)
MNKFFKKRQFSTPKQDKASQKLVVAKERIAWISLGFFTLFGVILLRLFDLTILQHKPHAPKEDKIERALTAFVPVDRGEILDRQGLALATNIPTVSVYADSGDIDDAEETALALHKILPDQDVKDLKNKLKSGKRFVWLCRHLTPKQHQDINDLGLPGIYFQKTSKRIYPQGSLASHILGFTDVDQKGISGVEKGFDEILSQNKPIQLALDLRAQHVLREKLIETIQEFSAQGGMGILMKISTGEIIALTSLPDFNPNTPGLAKDIERFNRATLGVYEMGSTFKLLTVAMALEMGIIKLTSIYDATNPVKIGRFTIRDYRGQKRPLNIPEVLIYSSNLAALKIALDVGSSRQKAFLERVGMLKGLNFELPERGRPLVPNPWREINTMTIAYGHGIAVTAIHSVVAASAIATGVLRNPTVLKQELELVNGHQVLSEATADKMRRLMRAIVLYGSGRKAAVTGYLVGGKTGTAEQLKNGRYDKNVNSPSFLGVFPMHDPKYAIFCMVDNPRPIKRTHGFTTGGWVAAPLAAQIIESVSPLLGVKPIDEEQSDIQKLVNLDMLANFKKK